MPHRRSVLTGIGAIATGTLAGCGAVTGLRVTNQTAEGTAFGNVEITVTIENPSSESQAGTLVGEVDIQGGETYTNSKQVTVPGETQVTESITIDIPISRSLSGGQYTYEARID